MDMGHLHLMLNHLPVLGVPALLALLVWGLAGNIPTVARGALWLTLALAAVTAAVYLTGEAAEELVEGLPSWSTSTVKLDGWGGLSSAQASSALCSASA